MAIPYEDLPFAEWLDGTAQSVIQLLPDYIGLVAVREADGMALTSYFNAGVREKSEFIHHILSDYLMEIIENNADTIRNIVMDGEDDEEDPDDDEIDGEDDEWQNTQLR